MDKLKNEQPSRLLFIWDLLRKLDVENMQLLFKVSVCAWELENSQLH